MTEIEASTPPRNFTKLDLGRMLLSGVILLAMIVGIVLASDYVFVWAIIAAYLLIWTQCITVSDAFEAVKGACVRA